MECSLNKSSLQKYYNNYRNNAMLELASVAFVFARHGRTLTGESPEHAQIVGSV